MDLENFELAFRLFILGTLYGFSGGTFLALMIGAVSHVIHMYKKIFS